MLRFDTPTAHVRSAAFLEGISYVVLLFIAMPLKYLADRPMAVRVAGLIHGVLFMWLMFQLFEGVSSRGRPRAWAMRIGIASIVPFGTLALDRRLREEDEEWRRENGR